MTKKLLTIAYKIGLMNAMAKSLGSVESLISAAWNRTRERFLSYFLALILGGLIIVGGAIGLFILSMIVLAIGTATKIPALLLLNMLLSFVGVMGMIFVMSWIPLALTNIIAEKTKVGVIESYKKVKPIVFPFIIVQFLTALFFVGLVPVSIVLLLIPIIVWSVWGSFMVFVYLDKKKTGLSNLWISRAMVGQNFWGIVGRYLLVYVAIMFLSLLVGGSGSRVVLFIWWICNILFVGPFFMSYLFEMYSQLDKPEDAPRPTIWVVASIIGFVIMILGAGAIIKTASETLPAVMDKQMNKQINEQFEKQYQERMNDPLYNNDKMRPAKIRYDL